MQQKSIRSSETDGSVLPSIQAGIGGTDRRGAIWIIPDLVQNVRHMTDLTGGLRKWRKNSVVREDKVVNETRLPRAVKCDQGL
jgi:hypothetical protein